MACAGHPQGLCPAALIPSESPSDYKSSACQERTGGSADDHSTESPRPLPGAPAELNRQTTAPVMT